MRAGGRGEQPEARGRITSGIVPVVGGWWYAYYRGERLGYFKTERGAKRAFVNAERRFRAFCRKWERIHDEIVDVKPKIAAELRDLIDDGRDARLVDVDFVIVAIRRMIGLDYMTPPRRSTGRARQR